MTEKTKARPKSEAEEETRAEAAGNPVSTEQGAHPNVDISDRVDQFVSILGKGLDLVEATVVLSVNLVTRLGSAVAEGTKDVAERAAAAYPAYTARPEPPYGSAEAATAPPYMGEAEQAQYRPPPVANTVSNRLTLFPGSPVAVSFTINNDSTSSPKRLRLHVEGFVGETLGFVLDGKGFVVKPATRVIAPMDFDKFTLVGMIAQGAPSDTYAGWIVVSGDEQIRVPIRLVVMPEG